jgi:hypothetical protein
MASKRYSYRKAETHNFDQIRVIATCSYRLDKKDGSYRTKYLFEIDDFFGRVEYDENGILPVDSKTAIDVLVSHLEKQEPSIRKSLSRADTPKTKERYETDIRRIGEIREFSRSMPDLDYNQFGYPFPAGEIFYPERYHCKVYVVGSDDGPYKVGITSTSMESRVTALQTGCPHPIKVFLSLSTPMAYQIEKSAHRILAKYNTSGEWFDAPLDLVLLIVNELHCLTVETQSSVNAQSMEDSRASVHRPPEWGKEAKANSRTNRNG